MTMRTCRLAIPTLVLLVLSWVAAGALPACGPAAPPTDASGPRAAGAARSAQATSVPASAAVLERNPLLEAWSGPHGGVPPFDRVRVGLFRPALERSIAAALADLERISRQPAPASFENTLVAMERATKPLDRVRAVYNVWRGAKRTPELLALEQEIEPQLAAFADHVTQNDSLFRRIEAVNETLESTGLTSEQQRLVSVARTDFVRAGANLDSAAKARLSEINQRLARQYARFAQNILTDETDRFLLLEGEEELVGVPESLRRVAAAEADARQLRGKWVIRNVRSAIEPFLTFAVRRDLRERAWRMFVDRGRGGGATDNNADVTEILQLRAERAELLGYRSYAHWRLEDTMAKTPEAALGLLEEVWPAAVARVRGDVAQMRAIANKQSPPIQLEPWDYRFYAEQLRRQTFALEESEIRPYLELERLREVLFWVAGELLGFEFRPVEGIPVFHPDVRVFEVVERANGRHVGLYYSDLYAREGKRSGAWESELRRQDRLDGEISPIVFNAANFVRGKGGEPVLVSWEDATTFFHEFGHALHGLSASVTYPSLTGSSVYPDYLEVPAQILEQLLPTPEVLQRLAHRQTGEPMPRELLRRIERAATFNQGFNTVEYLACALVEMKLHLLGREPIDPERFENDALHALGMPREIVMRHRTAQFAHVFAGDDYAAGYYSYLWSDVLAADALEAFREGGALFDPTLARRLRDNLFVVGNTIDPAEAYRRFRGRDAKIDALMRQRGFPLRNEPSGRKARAATPQTRPPAGG
jgi:peptidyl-dipeptidase Dcp